MIHRKLIGFLTLMASGAILAAVSLALAPASALAAGPATNCGGWLKRAPTSADPNALAYQFQCNWGITAYSIIATRKPNDFSTIDDFSPDGSAVDTSGNPVSGVDFDCAGVLPGNGVNCGLTSGYLEAPDFVEGWVDTSDPYCAFIPKGAPPGTTAQPQAIVQLVVTDTNGVQDGPFRLNLGGCGPTPKPKPKTKTKAKAKSTKHAKATRSDV